LNTEQLEYLSRKVDFYKPIIIGFATILLLSLSGLVKQDQTVALMITHICMAGALVIFWSQWKESGRWLGMFIYALVVGAIFQTSFFDPNLSILILAVAYFCQFALIFYLIIKDSKQKRGS